MNAQTSQNRDASHLAQDSPKPPLNLNLFVLPTPYTLSFTLVAGVILTTIGAK